MTRRIGMAAVPLEMHSSASVGRVRTPGGQATVTRRTRRRRTLSPASRSAIGRQTSDQQGRPDRF